MLPMPFGTSLAIITYFSTLEPSLESNFKLKCATQRLWVGFCFRLVLQSRQRWEYAVILCLWLAFCTPPYSSVFYEPRKPGFCNLGAFSKTQITKVAPCELFYLLLNSWWYKCCQHLKCTGTQGLDHVPQVRMVYLPMCHCLNHVQCLVILISNHFVQTIFITIP